MTPCFISRGHQRICAVAVSLITVDIQDGPNDDAMQTVRGVASCQTRVGAAQCRRVRRVMGLTLIRGAPADGPWLMLSGLEAAMYTPHKTDDRACAQWRLREQRAGSAGRR